MRTEPVGDGVILTAETDIDARRIRTLLGGLANDSMGIWLDRKRGTAEISGIEYPADENGHIDMVSNAMNQFVLTSPPPIKLGKAMSVLYTRASPSLRRKLDAMLTPPQRAAHKAYIEQNTRTLVPNIVEDALGISAAPDVSKIPKTIQEMVGRRRVRKTRSRTYKYARRTRRKN